MLPVGPLMTEHRLIERMIHLIRQELERIRSNVAVDPEFAFVDPAFIDLAVDFLRIYADRCHHGKEEDLLFRELDKKNLSPKHRRLMAELVQEHARAREATDRLLQAKEEHLHEEPKALEHLLMHLTTLVELYPAHIEKEDRHFFIPCLEYFSPSEKEALLARMHEFDRQMIHEKYRLMVESLETRRACAW
jgi:hemerythrin-like domain-containing protein|uniref:Cation-binding protein n=1 Tax=Desulfobacca acetoxidans TaxID=60893 RepID=A0A7C3SKB2_9BACT